MTEPLPDEDTPFWRDKTTGAPCPRRGPILCTVTDPAHLHRAIHMDTPAARAECPMCTHGAVPHLAEWERDFIAREALIERVEGLGGHSAAVINGVRYVRVIDVLGILGTCLHADHSCPPGTCNWSGRDGRDG